MYKIGIDLGGTAIKAGVIDGFSVVASSSLPTAMPRSLDEIAHDMYRAAASACEKAGISEKDIEIVGAGIPGTVNKETGVLEFSGNLNAHNYHIKDKLEELFGKKVYVENDANAASFGEAVAGAAKGARNAVCVTLGTGVGSGIIIDGKVYSGFNYAGAEFGHTVIVHEGRKCNCGRRGCWEVYASASALIYQTKVAMLNDPKSVLWELVENDLDRVNGKTPFDGMRMEDITATEVVYKFTGYVACGIVNIINVFQPDIVCVGGGISKEGETLMAPIRSYVRNERFSRYSEKQTKIVNAILGNDAGIIGAANLYLEGANDDSI